MAIELPSGFRITSAEPSDSRLTVANQTARLEFSAANVYNGLIVYQQDTEEVYVLTDAVNNTLAASWKLVAATGSLLTTASFNSYTSSNTSQFAGTASYALTASHAPLYLPLTGGTISGSLVIQNNLTVLGSASIQHISESVLNIGTNIITVNTATPSIRFGGLSVIDSGSSPAVSASLLYDSLQDEFIFVHKGTSTSAITSSHFVLGPETYNNLGDEIYLSQNRIPKSVGNEHLNDSNITDSGTTVSINSNTQVTGSLIVTQGISGSFSGSGANLFNIPASGITGLNLSQIASGSVSASISEQSGLQVNTNITATSFTGSLEGTASYSRYPFITAVVTEDISPAGSLPNTDYIYLVSGSFTVTLPTAVGNTSRYDIKNIRSGSTATIATTSTQTIDGSLTATLPVQYTSLTLVSDNANWSII